MENRQLLEEFKKKLKQSEKEGKDFVSKFKTYTSAITKKKFPDGSVYEGTTKTDGTRHGIGIMYFGDGGVYFGDWGHDHFHGSGVFVTSN